MEWVNLKLKLGHTMEVFSKTDSKATEYIDGMMVHFMMDNIRMDKNQDLVDM